MPEAQSACPGAPELASFHAGRLDEEVAERVAEHVEACAACRGELAELALDRRLDDELRELFPGGAVAADGPDAELRALVELLREAAEGRRYEILGELGHGGMGVVYDVRDRVLHRDLAMKVARADRQSGSSEASPTGQRLARFLAEVRINGQLDHPSIIPVHDLGLDSQGRAFFTMMKVRGRDLHEVIEGFERGADDWTLQRLVGVLQRACEAVAYAHSKGVVHRDLKPANVMVGRFGAVYVMDWGIARMAADDGSGSRDGDSHVTQRIRPWPAREGSAAEGGPASPMTLAGEILGTPAYMAPEQAFGRTDGVGFQADVYSMGALLYRLLAGRSPYDDAGDSATPHAAWKRLLEGPPAPLSEVAPLAPPELVAVCERAMARDTAARYPDMLGLSADLSAWLEGRVVRAHRTGVLVEVRKWVGRNRALARAGLLVMVVLTALSGLLVRSSVSEAHHRDEIAHSRDEIARGASMLAAQRLLDVDPAQALDLALQVARADENYVSRTTLLAAFLPLYQEAYLRAQLSTETSIWTREGLHRAWGPAGTFFVFGGRESAGDPVAIRVWNVETRGLTGELFQASTSANHIVVDRQGRRIAAGGADGSLSIHDRRTGESLTLGGGRAHESAVTRLSFDPGGALLASASWDGSIRLWDTSTGALVRSLEGHAGIVTAVEFDAGGEWLLSASGPPKTEEFTSDHTARVWDVASGNCLFVFTGHDSPVSSAHFDPRGELVLSTSYSGAPEENSAQLWEWRSGRVLHTLPISGVGWAGAFSPDGSRLAVASNAGFLVQDIASGRVQPVGFYQAHDGCGVSDVEFSPGGDRLLTMGFDKVGRVWNLDAEGRPQLALRLPGHQGDTFSGSWSPDGSRIATGDAFGTHLWLTAGNPLTGWVRPSGDAEIAAQHARFHPAGDRVLLGFEGRPAYEYGFAAGQGLRLLGTLGDRPASDVVTTADGAFTLVAEQAGPIRLWRREGSGASLEIGTIPLEAKSLHPGPAHERVAAILAGGGAAVLDLSREPPVVLRLPVTDAVSAICVSEDGRRAALGTEHKRILVVDLEDGRVLVDGDAEPLSPSQSQVFDIAFHDDGRGLLAAGPNGGVEVWDVGRGVLLRTQKLASTVGGLLVLRAAPRLLTCEKWSGGGVFRTELADEGASALLHPPGQNRTHRARITSWSIDAEQRRLLTTSLDHAATVWDLERDEPWVTFAGHAVPVLAGDLSPDGAWAVTADASGLVFVWPTDPLAWAGKVQPVDTGADPR